MANFFGKMEGCIKVDGLMASNKELVFIYHQICNKGKDNGNKVIEFAGSNNLIIILEFINY